MPFRVVELAFESMAVIKAMAEIGNPNSVTDAGVGALCARTAVRGALLNVKINAAGLKDQAFANDLVDRGEAIAVKAAQLEEEIMAIVEAKL